MHDMRRLLLLIVVFVGVAVFLVVRFAGGSAPRDMEVVIPAGSSLTAAAAVLERAGAIGSTDAFLSQARLFGSKAPIKPGEYLVKKGMDAQAILGLLQSGKVLQRFVVIPEGLPSILVYERLYATPLLTGEIPVPPEGSVLPDAYSYVRGETLTVIDDDGKVGCKSPFAGSSAVQLVGDTKGRFLASADGSAPLRAAYPCRGCRARPWSHTSASACNGGWLGVGAPAAAAPRRSSGVTAAARAILASSAL